MVREGLPENAFPKEEDGGPKKDEPCPAPYAKATDIARSMVARYGMDEDLGYVSYDSEQPSFLGQPVPRPLERRYSEATAEKLDEAVKDVISETFARTLAILHDNRDVLEQAARELLAEETLDADTLLKLVKGLKRPAELPAPINPPALGGRLD